MPTLPRRLWTIAAVVFAGLVVSVAARAAVANRYIVHSNSRDTMRVQVAMGPGQECNDFDNDMVFDGPLDSGQTLILPYDQCVCIRTTASGTENGFGDSQHYCRTQRTRRGGTWTAPPGDMWIQLPPA